MKQTIIALCALILLGSGARAESSCVDKVQSHRVTAAALDDAATRLDGTRAMIVTMTPNQQADLVKRAKKIRDEASRHRTEADKLEFVKCAP